MTESQIITDSARAPVSGDGQEQSIECDEGREGVSFFDLLVVLSKYKKIVVGLPIAAAVIAAAYSLSLPDIYTASTKILPPQANRPTAAGMLAQIGGLTGAAGGSLGLKNPNELYIGMLKSRRVADALIERFDLNNVFQEKLQSDTRATLLGMTKVEDGDDGMIAVKVDDIDPQRAADIANAYVEELYKLTSVLAVTEASQRRLFYEQQLTQAKDNLARAESFARQSLEKGGVIQVEGQGRAVMETASRLRAQITGKEVQIGAMRAFASDANPELLAAQQELQAMRRELAKMEGEGLPRVKGRQVDGASSGIDNFTLLRDVKYHETLYELLAKQYELAKLDEAKEAAVIQVLDKAIPPDRKSKPSRRIIVLLAAGGALFLGVLWAVLREAMLKARKDPQQAAKIDAIRRNLKSR